MKRDTHTENKSLKTVYLYLVLVFVIICIALAVKVFYIFQQSRFDSSHEFILAVVQHNNIKEIVAFHPETSAISQLEIQDPNIAFTSLAKNYGIATDGYIETEDSNVSQDDLTSLLWQSIVHMAMWHSNLTVLDKLRLILFAKNVSINNKSSEEISLVKQTPDLNTIIATALNDQTISSENVTIQIINATNVSGLGQRLGKVLTNMGANVVDVSSSDSIEQKSTIAYFGSETYTVDHLQKFLGITASKFTKQTIADIVITIGTDKEKTSEF